MLERIEALLDKPDTGCPCDTGLEDDCEACIVLDWLARTLDSNGRKDRPLRPTRTGRGPGSLTGLESSREGLT